MKLRGGALQPRRATNPLPCFGGGLHTRHMPTVSVVLVFHRHLPYLASTLSSLLSQTWRDFELVLVDNGVGLTSGDLGGLGADPRLVWVRLLRDEGIGPATNAGLAVARGEFIALHDWDDLSFPHRLERQVEALRENPSVDLVSAHADMMDGEGRALGRRLFTLVNHGEFLRYSQYAAPFINPLLMGRRDVLTKLLWRPEFRYAGDLDFQARFCEHWRALVLPEVLMRYRWHSSQTTQRFARAIAQSRHVIALWTARRRAGRDETGGRTPPISDALTSSEHARQSATLALNEGYFAPAAYLARRSIALARHPLALWRAIGLAGAAFRRAPAADRRLVMRIFFSGPVRALNVRPA